MDRALIWWEEGCAAIAAEYGMGKYMFADKLLDKAAFPLPTSLFQVNVFLKLAPNIITFCYSSQRCKRIFWWPKELKISLLVCIQWTAQLTQYALPATRNQISRRCTPPRASTFCSDVSCTGQLIKNRQNTVPGNIDADHFLFTVLVQIVILAILGVSSL